MQRNPLVRMLMGAALLLPGMQAQSTASLAARVQRMEDVEEIRIVLTEYGKTLDARDFAAYSQLFAKDGEWVGGFQNGEGSCQRSRRSWRRTWAP